MDTGNTQFFRYSTARRFPINGVFFINSAEFNYLTCSISNIPRPPATFPFLFTSILEFLQLKYQGKQETPFDMHPCITSVGIVSLLVYCYLGYYAEHYRFPSSSNHGYIYSRRGMRVGKYVAGSVSLASTVSILFPDSIRPILFVIFLFIAVVELLMHSLCRRHPARRQILPL